MQARSRALQDSVDRPSSIVLLPALMKVAARHALLANISLSTALLLATLQQMPQLLHMMQRPSSALQDSMDRPSSTVLLPALMKVAARHASVVNTNHRRATQHAQRTRSAGTRSTEAPASPVHRPPLREPALHAHRMRPPLQELPTAHATRVTRRRRRRRGRALFAPLAATNQLLPGLIVGTALLEVILQKCRRGVHHPLPVMHHPHLLQREQLIAFLVRRVNTT